MKLIPNRTGSPEVFCRIDLLTLERCLACEADGRSPETLPFPGGPVQRRHKTLGLRKESFSAKVRQPPQDPESKRALESDSLIATL